MRATPPRPCPHPTAYLQQLLSPSPLSPPTTDIAMPCENLPSRPSTIKSPIARLYAPCFSDLYHVHLRRALFSQGVACVTLQFPPPPNRPLANAIAQIFSTTELHTLPPVTAPHGPLTDLPTQTNPPRYTALYNPGPMSSSPTLSVANLFNATNRLAPIDASSLRSVPVSLGRHGPRPLFKSAWCGRLPADDVTLDLPTHLVAEKNIKFQTVLSDLHSLVADQCLLNRNTVTMPVGTLVIIDNHRFAHAITDISASQWLQHVAFSLRNSAELDAVLFAAAVHPFYADIAPQDVLDFRKWRMVDKPELVRKSERHFKDLSYGGAGLYFGPSGGSSTKSLAVNGHVNGHVDRELMALSAMPAPFRGVLPAALSEVNEMRLIFRDLCLDVGLMAKETVLANIMVSGIGGRSLEVVFHAFTDAHVTNFPVESRISDPDLCRFVHHYGVTTIIGMATRLIQFGIYCKRNSQRFDSMKAVMHAGEAVNELQFNPLRQMGPAGSEVAVYASYGSSEVGEFSIRYADRTSYLTWEDAMLVELVDDDGNLVAEGDVGRVVVTNLRRKKVPLVRFCQDDLARFVPKTGEFEIVGRHRSQIYRDLGAVRLYWSDVVDKVGGVLIEAFDGAVLFQLWSHDGKKGDNAKEVTLAVYAAARSAQQIRQVERSALVALDKLIEGSSVQTRRVSWLGDEQLIRAHSHKLRTFVSPDMLSLSTTEAARCTSAR